jgi:flagellar biogenesis protein FliO
VIRADRIWLKLIVLLCAMSPVYAQATKPAVAILPPATQPTGQHEKQAIQRAASAASTKPSTGSKTVPPISTGLDTTRVVLSLVLVIGVIFLLRWIAQQFFGAPSTKKSSRAVQVLSRSMITPKQHVLLLQVGRRVIVVGDSGTQMNPLCEITDADEIASLVGQLRQDKADPVSRAFGTFFGKAEKDYSADAAEDRPPAAAGNDPDLDPALATTQAELSGLIDKVRSVSKRLEQG